MITMKHNRFDARNFNKKQKLRCKMCSRNSTKGSKYCSTTCEDKDKKQISREYVYLNLGVDNTSASASTVW